MKFWMTGLFGAMIAGGTWTVLWHVIISILAVLMWGIPMSLQIASTLIAGMLAGAFVVLKRPRKGYTYHLFGLMITAFLVLIFTFGQPFKFSTEMIDWKAHLLLLLHVGFSWWCITSVVKDIKIGQNQKYLIEKFYLNLLWGLGLIIFLLIVFVPFYIMIVTSLKSQQSLLLNPLDLSIDLKAGYSKLFGSYIELFTEYNFLTYLLNSFLVSISTVPITLIFSIPGAYAVSRLRFPGRKWFSGSILMIYLIPAIVLVIPLYAVFSQIGLRNSILGLCVVYPATTIPVALYMLQGYFSSLPRELDDAALIDGLSRAQIITKIALPLSMPAIASVSLYVFMIAWNEFLFAFMFLDDVNLFTLSRGIVSLDSSEVPRQHLMAGSVVATIPVLIIFLWFERYLVSGLTTGSVKG